MANTGRRRMTISFDHMDVTVDVAEMTATEVCVRVSGGEWRLRLWQWSGSSGWVLSSSGTPYQARLGP